MPASPDASPPNLGDILVNQGAISRSQLHKALEAQKANAISLGRILVQMGFINEKTRMSVLQMAFGFEVFDPGKFNVDRAAGETIPRPFAEKHRIFPIRSDGKANLVVAMEDPSDAVVLDAVAHMVQMEIKPLIAASADLNALLQGHAQTIAPPKPRKTRGRAYKLLRALFLPVLAFGPLGLFLALVKFSEDFSGYISDNVKSMFDAVIWVGLGWGTWCIIIFYINGLIFPPEDEEEL